MSVEEWGEYITYSGDEIKVGKSYRIYNAAGELVATGIEWVEIERKPGLDEVAEIRKARESLNMKLAEVRERVKKGEIGAPHSRA